mgnify:CR=1 FL=1
MKLATWNVNGVRARATELVRWIDREEPDVICLQEIKAGPAQVPAMLTELPGYHTHWHGAGGYSGVALLVPVLTTPGTAAKSCASPLGGVVGASGVALGVAAAAGAGLLAAGCGCSAGSATG